MRIRGIKELVAGDALFVPRAGHAGGRFAVAIPMINKPDRPMWLGLQHATLQG